MRDNLIPLRFNDLLGLMRVEEDTDSVNTVASRTKYCRGIRTIGGESCARNQLCIAEVSAIVERITSGELMPAPAWAAVHHKQTHGSKAAAIRT